MANVRRVNACPECGERTVFWRDIRCWKCGKCGCEWIGGVSRPAQITYHSPLASPTHGTRPEELADAVMGDILAVEVAHGCDGSPTMASLVGDEEMFALVLGILQRRVAAYRGETPKGA